MGGSKFGITSLSNHAVNSKGGVKPYSSSDIFYVRVKDIILSKDHPLFNEYGAWTSIGTIICQKIYPYINNPNEELIGNIVASPLFPNYKHYPLINEIVALYPYLPDSSLSGISMEGKKSAYYYISPINLWASQHHNAVSIGTENTLSPSQQKNYQQTSAGSVNRVTNGGTEIDLGNTFVEQTNINPLQPFEGDFIVEGRFGQSLRFGSSEGKDPITKIRNGQGTETSDGWVTINENINQDKASIYLTSTQQINLEPNIFNYNSYTTAPESIANYSSNQVLINSGRLVLNSNTDSILLSSAKSINLNSQDSVNIDSKNTVVINSPSILLGDKNATEPVLKGDITIELLSELVDELRKWMTQFNTNPSPYLAPLKVSTTPLISTLVKLKTELETKTKSKVSKTI
jgi:hypothetical protein